MTTCDSPRWCTTCGAAPGERCITRNGNQTELHTVRYHCAKCGAGRVDRPPCFACGTRDIYGEHEERP